MEKEQTLRKVTDFLNTVKRNNFTQFGVISKLAKEYKYPLHYFYSAVNCGYFKRVKTGRYECTLPTDFQPINAKKIIDAYNSKYFNKEVLPDNPVKSLTNEELIAELKSRGFSGKLEIKQQVVI
jgi:hypothetical protein